MEFNSAEFFASDHKQRTARCRAFAAEAERRARLATGESRDGYFDLAKKWSALADEIETLSGGEAHG